MARRTVEVAISICWFVVKASRRKRVGTEAESVCVGVWPVT